MTLFSKTVTVAKSSTEGNNLRLSCLVSMNKSCGRIFNLHLGRKWRKYSCNHQVIVSNPWIQYTIKHNDTKLHGINYVPWTIWLHDYYHSTYFEGFHGDWIAQYEYDEVPWIANMNILRITNFLNMILSFLRFLNSFTIDNWIMPSAKVWLLLKQISFHPHKRFHTFIRVFPQRKIMKRGKDRFVNKWN